MAQYYNNQPPYQAPQQPGYQQPPVYPQQSTTENTIPPQYRPLSPWAYFGYSLLFGIPIVGLIMAIVFSFSDENINRRNYARSFFCALLIAVIVSVVLAVIGLIVGASVFNLFDFGNIF